MKALIVIAATLLSTSAFANHGVLLDTTSYSCQELRTILRKAGPSGRDFTTNGEDRKRYYSDFFGNGDGYCGGSQRAVTGWAQSSSGKQCPVGYVCVDKNN